MPHAQTETFDLDQGELMTCSHCGNPEGPDINGWLCNKCADQDRLYAQYQDWREVLEARRSVMHQLVHARYGIALSGTASDLEILQQIVDDRLIEVEDVDGWSALGVVFGDCIAAYSGASWQFIMGYSRSPVLILSHRSGAIAPIDALKNIVALKEGKVCISELWCEVLQFVKKPLSRSWWQFWKRS